MTELQEMARGIANIVPQLSVFELEDGCEAFLQDIEEGADISEADYLFPILIDAKLKFYEAEY